MRLREDRELHRTLASFLKRFESTDATEIGVPQPFDVTDVISMLEDQAHPRRTGL